MRATASTARKTLALLLGAGLLGTTGCIHVHHRHHGAHGPEVARDDHRHGPPDHAPAHGHRRKHPRHSGVEIVFDDGIGVYTVVGRSGIYWDGDRYLRWHDSSWWVSARSPPHRSQQTRLRSSGVNASQSSGRR